MLHPSTIQLLRFHFSFFLLPVFLFALSQAKEIHWTETILAFAILHLLVYPSSNGYNSYMDRDQSPIGGLKDPMQPTRQLYTITVIIDVIAIILSALISYIFCLGILLYILASRAYSYRGIRLKKYPVTGFLTVFIFQGMLVFVLSYLAISQSSLSEIPLIPCLIAGLLIGALYPLTQVYQHEADHKDGVTSISMLLGKKGSFIFSMILFLSASFLFYLLFRENDPVHFLLYLGVMLPVVLFFLYWMMKVWKDGNQASFSNSLRMNLVSTLCTTVFFITLIILKH